MSVISVASAAAAVGGGPVGAARGGPPSLECISNTVPESGECGEYHICGNRCRSWFCPHCAKIQGPRLRKKLIDRVEGWRSSMMLTFTVDPEFFESPEAAFKWVTEHRAIARVMKRLAPFLCRGDWFCVIEWHESGWPHWHVLCDAEFIPIEEVREEWGRFVPKNLRHLIRPKIRSLGIVRFSKPDQFKSAKHAALYVSKYLTKFPDEGFAEWVMQARYRIRRFSTSRGFWGKLTERELTECEVEDSQDVDREDAEEMHQVRSHEERGQGCCKSCTVYAVSEEIDTETGECRKVRSFFCRIVCPAFALADAVRRCVSSYPELAFVRGCFVQWRETWPCFVSFLRNEPHLALLAKFIKVDLVYSEEDRLHV